MPLKSKEEITPNLFSAFWGKARPGATSAYPFHPVWSHGLDVAAAGRALIQARPKIFRALSSNLGLDIRQFEAIWLHLLALHDIGKFSPLFQIKAPHYPPGLQILDSNMVQMPDPGHPKAGLLFVEGAVQSDVVASALRYWPRKARNRLLPPIFGHHGRPVGLGDAWHPDDWRPLFGAAAAAALEYWKVIDRLLPMPVAAVPSSASLTKASWMISGYTALADWIGSNQAWFPYISPEADVEAYWSEACSRAEHAVHEAGLAPVKAGPRKAFSELTGIRGPPTATQRWADTTPLPEGPLLVLIEDVTGGGKTEAALIIAHRLLSDGRADGLYFALPTMATANAMFERIEDIAPRLYDDTVRPSLTLAHGRARLHPRFRYVTGDVDASQAPAGSVDGDSAAEAKAWLSGESRRALLADLGVGTIDQAVLAVLPNRYGTVRLAGLAGKVLIVDEAHGPARSEAPPTSSGCVSHMCHTLGRPPQCWGGRSRNSGT